MTDKPFSQACENNKRPILDVLEHAFATRKHVLEIGSGTGQHAVFMSANLPHLIWQTSDQTEYHGGIQAWLDDENVLNCKSPMTLKIGEQALPDNLFDGIYTANTAHIMQREEVELMMQQVSDVLPPCGVFCQYGPFTEDGEFSSQSNAEFHASLLERGCGGYRDISELTKWAPKLTLQNVYRMPANNLMLVWTK
ncbi:DUF938 domain-containing protein [Alteromonas antoniana]|uniref:DUF938 domain-containing protein n=1 Tax=Alteromonas antoniana TaxID=2803813 RepID=UPI001C440E41|nr:DUF938 domain-containing protein [Alteromonas antoniana]